MIRIMNKRLTIHIHQQDIRLKQKKHKKKHKKQVEYKRPFLLEVINNHNTIGRRKNNQLIPLLKN